MTYPIGEVCKLLGIKPHVVRYWEKEIPMLAPRKNLAGRRVYSHSDLQRLFRLKHLLYEQKYTLKGAKEKIWTEIQQENPDLKSRIAEIRGILVDAEHRMSREKENVINKSISEIFDSLGQETLYPIWESLSEEKKQKLLEDLRVIEPRELLSLQESLQAEESGPSRIEPVQYLRLEKAKENNEALKLGHKAISSGKTAFLTVAGGQGSRLGFDGPKGLFPISPIRRISLFQIFAEKLISANRYYATTIPWYIMTSPQNHHDTYTYLEENGYFGIDSDQVILFPQGILPSLDDEGNLMIGEDGFLLQNPDGHGGMIAALKRHNLIEDLETRKIEELFYFQVDNPLVNLPDPLFLGTHLLAGSQVSTKVVRKQNPEEKIGVIGRIDGKPGIIEYSDLDGTQMNSRDETGDLVFSQGNIAVHILNVSFLARDDLVLPYHVARKKVKALIIRDGKSEIEEREANKLEKFIFDIIPEANRVLFFETERGDEFAPLKNREGQDSIDTCIEGQINKSAVQLGMCGIQIPKDESGLPVHRYEISPLYAFDVSELKEKLANAKIDANSDCLFL